MTDDVRIRVDQFFAAPKTLQGSWVWSASERVNVYKFRREIAESGVLGGFRMEADAHIGTFPNEFRFLVVGLDECVFRLDCAPTIDGEHINGPNAPFGFPFALKGHHYHPWKENRQISSSRKIGERLPYALESPTKISTIQQGFWVFCRLVGISATSADEPYWPNRRDLL